MKSIWPVLAICMLLFLPKYAAAQDTIEDEELGLDEFETFGPGIEDADDQKFSEPTVDGSGLEKGAQTQPMEGTLSGVTPGIYLIAGGDNLWDICSRFLGNPFEWPKLWSINQYITNPHFIYPGDKIIFHPGTETTMPRMEIAKEVDLTEGQEEPVQEEESPKPKPKKVVRKSAPKEFRIKLKTESFLSKKDLDESGVITHSGEPKNLLSAGDPVYLKFKNPEAVSVGDNFVVFEKLEKVRHPVRGKFMGYKIFRKGKIKIVAKDKTKKGWVFTGKIMDAVRVITRGDRVIPYKSYVVKINPKELNSDLSGYIIGSEQDHRLIGQQEFAYVDLGKNNGVDAGTVLYVVRRGDGLLAKEDKNLPYVIIGKLVVVKAKEKTSTVIILDSKKSLEAGDVVKTKL